MKEIALTLLLGAVILVPNARCQKGPARYLGDPIITDSLSTLFIPTRYNEEFLSSNKIAFWGDYYANIIAYNFRDDSYTKVFEKDTFVEAIRYDAYGHSARIDEAVKNITSKWVFLLVKTKDMNQSGRIDEKDPSVLMAVSRDGKTIQQLTSENENVVSFDNFDKLGFLLIKIQRDSNKDKSFKTEDRQFYYRRVSLPDLSLGREISLEP